jgi:hypothetical protein
MKKILLQLKSISEVELNGIATADKSITMMPNDVLHIEDHTIITAVDGMLVEIE